MTAGLRMFDNTLQKTHAWLQDIMDELGIDDRRKAYLVLRATLHTLRDRLPPDEALNLGAQLPMLIRGFYYEGWKPSGKVKVRTKEDFIESISLELTILDDLLDADVEELVRGVFRVIASRISKGELKYVVNAMPVELKELWPRV